MTCHVLLHQNRCTLGVAYSRHNMLILCIDDDPQSLSIREKVLRAHDIDVFSARTAQAGIGFARQNKVDAVVLDYLMPDMDGEEVARVLKREHPELPIILYSGWAEIPERVFKLVDAFVTKGDGGKFLVAVIQAVVLRRQPPRPERWLRRTGS